MIEDPIKVFVYTRPSSVRIVHDIHPQRTRTIDTTLAADGSSVTHETDEDSSIAIATGIERINDDITSDSNFIMNRGDMIQVAINSLVNTGAFTVVNRQNLDVLERELKLQHDHTTAAFDQDQIISTTKLLGANHFIVVTPVTNTDANTAEAQPYAIIMALSSIDTGEIAASQQGIGAGVTNAIEDAAQKLSNFVNQHRERIAPIREPEPKQRPTGL